MVNDKAIRGSQKFAFSEKKVVLLAAALLASAEQNHVNRMRKKLLLIDSNRSTIRSNKGTRQMHQDCLLSSAGTPPHTIYFQKGESQVKEMKCIAGHNMYALLHEIL